MLKRWNERRNGGTVNGAGGASGMVQSNEGL